MRLLENALKNLVPIYAQGFFTVFDQGIYQTVIFDYYDKEKYYLQVTEDNLLYEKEIKRLAFILEEELNKETILLNKKVAEPVLTGIDIVFRGTEEHVSIVFYVFIKGRINKGINVFEDKYNDTVAEYDYEAYWFLPPGWRIIDVHASGEHQVFGTTNNMLVISARRGDEIRGYEKIVFEATL